MSNEYGPLFIARQLETAVVTTLQTWYPDYLKRAEYIAQLPVGVLSAPRDYTHRNRFETIPAEKTPLCVVVSPGIQGTPKVDGNGVYRASWIIGIGVADAHKDDDTADLHAKIHAATVRMIMLQKQNLGLGGVVRRVDWIDESYDDVPVRDQILQYRASVNTFIVDIDGVAQRGTGPQTVGVPPDTNWPLFSTVDVTVVKEDING